MALAIGVVLLIGLLVTTQRHSPAPTVHSSSVVVDEAQRSFEAEVVDRWTLKDAPWPNVSGLALGADHTWSFIATDGSLRTDPHGHGLWRAELSDASGPYYTLTVTDSGSQIKNDYDVEQVNVPTFENDTMVWYNMAHPLTFTRS